MSTELGEFKGLPITGHALSLKNAGDGLSKAMAVAPTDFAPGEEIDLLIRAKAGNISMKIDDIDHPAAWVLEQSLSAVTVTIVNREFADDKIAAQRLAEVKLKEAQDRRKGITKLPGMSLADKGDIVHTDENGVLLTDAEVAERRGDGRPVIERAPARPAVVVYTDGFKQQWPDDFAPGDDRPRKGDVLEGVDGAPDRWVIELLDMVTAEPIGDDPDGFAQLADQSTDLDDEPDDDDTSAEGEAFSSDAASTPVSDLANIEDDDDTRLPTTVDFEDVSQTIPAVKLLVKGCDDIRRLRRLLLAEQRGRGTASEPRPAIVSHITARLVALGGL